MSKIKKAVIAVAGRGTRFLPATKAMPKELIPIIDKPIIQYLVEELVSSGITDIILVTSSNNIPIENHFDESVELVDYLYANGKDKYAEMVKSVSSMANFIYVRQKGPYGNGTPCYCVRHLVEDGPFVYCFGDDLVKSRTPFTKQLIDQHESLGGMVLGVQEIDRKLVHKYGIVKVDKQNNDGPMKVEQLIEKPKVEEAPSNLAQFGRFVLTPDVFNYLNPDKLGKGGELWLTDAIAAYLDNGGTVTARSVNDGRWLTTGDPINYLEAMLAYLGDRPDIMENFKGRINLD